MSRIVRFEPFEIDLAARVISKRGKRLRLSDQPFSVLAALLRRPGEVVTREELRRCLWPDDVFVDFDNILNTAVANLRRTLGDSAERPRFIETLPKHGYRFIATVSGVPPADPMPAERPRLLVLPFVNTSGDPGQEYFSDAVTDELVTALVGFSSEDLAVLARTTTFHYKESHEDLAAIARTLRLDYVVEGSARRDREVAVINVRLMRACGGSHVWGGQFSGRLSDLYTIGLDIANTIGEKLGIVPRAGAARRRPTEDLEAYTLYQQGRRLMQLQTPEGFASARRSLEQAVERDPQFALGYDALAELFWYTGFFGFAPPKEMGGPGMCCALKALEIDPSLAETHALVALYRWLLDFNWDEGRRHMERARELNWSSPLVKLRYAIGPFISHGRMKEAIREIEAALESDPLSILMLMWLGCAYWLDRQYDRAIELGRLMIETAPTNHIGYWSLGMYSRDKGLWSESIAAHRKAVELSGGSALMRGWLGLALGQAGDTAAARVVLADLYAAAGRMYVPPSCFAWTHLGLGELDEAFEWLDRSIDGRDHMIVALRSYPFLDPLRGDPRYHRLLQKFNRTPLPQSGG